MTKIEKRAINSAITSHFATVENMRCEELTLVAAVVEALNVLEGFDLDADESKALAWKAAEYWLD